MNPSPHTSRNGTLESPEIRSVLNHARAVLLSTRYAFGKLPENAYATHLEGRFTAVIAEIDRLLPREILRTHSEGSADAD